MRAFDEAVLKNKTNSKTKTTLKVLFFPLYLIFLVGRGMFEESDA